MNTVDNPETPIETKVEDKQYLSQQFLLAAATISTYPGTREYFNFAILPEMSLASHLNVDDRLESCLKRYLLIQHGYALSGNSLSPNELTILNHVAQTFSKNIAHDGPECNSAEAEY